MSQPQLSVVIPVHDEQETLRPLYEGICQALEPLGRELEIIFVDDGSQDRSFEQMKAIHEKDPRVTVLRFWRNAGKSAALAAGFDEARGEVVFTIDADLQDDPQELPALLAQLEEGCDLVSGWKKDRKDSLAKRWLSWIFNRVVSQTSGLQLHDFNCGLKVYRGEVVKRIRLYGERHRFIPVLAKAHGHRITEQVVTHHPRRAGRSKYGFERIWRGAIDFFVIWFLNVCGQYPSRYFVKLSFGVLLFKLVEKGVGMGAASGEGAWLWLEWTLAAIWDVMLIPFLLIHIGLIAELITHAFYQDHPAYTVNERLGSS